jgi:hypothetical protein
MNKNDIIRKIKSILKFTETNGCTEAEVAAAGEKLQILMNKYQIDFNEIKSHYNEKDIDIEEMKFGYKNFPIWLRAMVNCVCQAFDCKPVHSFWYDENDNSNTNKIKIELYGDNVEVKIAYYFLDYLYDHLYDVAEKSAFNNQIFGVSKRKYINNFCIGACREISSRLKQKRIKEDEKIRNINDHNALLVSKTKAIENFISKKYPSMISKKVKYSSDYNAMKNGIEHGKNMQLNSGIETSNANTKMIGN